MEAYRKWVLRNKQWLATIESLASSLTWFLPDRFAESELAPEALSSLIGLFSAINSHIIATAPAQPLGTPHPAAAQGAPGAPRLEGGSQQSRGAPLSLEGGSEGTGGNTAGAPEAEPENSEARRRCSVEWAVLALALVREVEVLGEMTAEHLFGGEDRKWTSVALIEGLKAILRLLLVRHEGQWHLLQEGSSCYHPEEEAQEEGREQTKQQGGVTQHQHPGQHPGPGPWTTTQRPWAGPGYAPSALQGPGAWNGLPPGPSMGWPPPHALPPHHPQHGFTPFPPSGPGIVHPSHPIPCPPAHPGSFHPFLRPPPLAPHGWPGHADGPWADRVAEGNTAWGTGDNPWSNMPGDNRRGEGSSQPQGVGSISGPVSMDPPRLGAPWSFRPRAFSQGQPPGSPWNDSGTPSSSGSTLGSSGGIPFPSPGDATPPLSSSTHPGTLASLEQSVQESPRNGGHPAETPGVHQEPAGSPGVQLRANGEGSDAAPSSSSVPLASLGSELQDSEPKNKALQAFLRFQGRLGAGGTSRGPVTESRAQRAPTNGEGHEGLSGLAANFGEENQHPGHQAGAPWDPAAQPMQLPPHQGQCWPQQAHQHQQPFVGPFGGWHQPGRPWGPPIGVPGAAPNAPWYWEGRSMPGPGPPTQAFGPQQRCWPQQGHSQSDHLQEGYTEGTHTRASADGAKPSGRMQALLVCSEVLHVVRPVVYALALRRWGKQSWKPWLASLSLDVASLALLHYHLSRLRTSASLARGLSPQGQGQQMQRHQGPAQGQGPGQRGQRREAGQTKGTKAAPERSQAEAAVLAELQRRKYLLILYLLRSPCFETVTKPPLEALQSGLSHVPLLGSLAGRAWDMLLGIQSLYFYTAGS